jgi:hypothetical protein
MSELDLEIREAVQVGVSYTDLVRQYSSILGTDAVYEIIEEYEGPEDYE